MKKFKFNNQQYELTSLVKYHYDSNLKDFKTGEVVDIEDGICFDIKDIFNMYKDYISDLLEKANAFSSCSERSTIKKIYNNKIKDVRKIELANKIDESSLENDEILITLEEMDEFVSLMGYKEKERFKKLNYDSFMTINHAKTKPEGLSDSDWGKFFRLIYMMNYDNIIKHKNGKTATREYISKYLGFKHVVSYDNYMAKLKKNNVILKTEPNIDGDIFILINPAYIMKDIDIDYTIYSYFKKDLDEILTKSQILYIRLKKERRDTLMIKVLKK